MVAEHIFLDAPQSVNDCRDLMHDVETVPFRLNHFRQAAHLSFDAAQARLLSLVVNFDAAVRGFIGFGFVFFQVSLTPYSLRDAAGKTAAYS